MRTVLKNMLALIGRAVRDIVRVILAVAVIAMILIANGTINTSAVNSRAVDAFLPSDANVAQKLWMRTFHPAPVEDYGICRVAKYAEVVDNKPTGLVGYAVAFGNRWIHVWTERVEDAAPVQVAQN